MIETIRGTQAVRDGQTHIGIGQLGEYRAIDVLHHRVHNGLRVNDDVDAVYVDAKERRRLHDFETLVHQCGGVDGDLRAHRPGRVVQRLVLGRALQLVKCPSAKWSAGCRNEETTHVGIPGAMRGTGEALMNGAVL